MKTPSTPDPGLNPRAVPVVWSDGKVWYVSSFDLPEPPVRRMRLPIVIRAGHQAPRVGSRFHYHGLDWRLTSVTLEPSPVSRGGKLVERSATIQAETIP